MRLTTSVGGVTFASPLLLASGFITETPAFYERARRFGCAGMVTRSLKESVPPERSRIPAPRYAVPDPNTMLNCEWGNEHPWTQWRDGWLDQAKRDDGRVIVSLSGRDIESCAHLITAFEALDPHAYEINVSCSHSGALHGNLNIDIDHVRMLVRRLRGLTRRPIWIKLSYSTILIEMAIAAQEEGCDAIVCTNSIGPALLLDTETGAPKLGIKDGAGGLTGKVIFPIALRCIYELYKALTIPIVGVGGAYTADDIIQMLMAGARAVQLYTRPALQGPRVFAEITADLQTYLTQHPQYARLESIVGLAHQFNREHSFVAPPPQIIAAQCTGCVECFPACAFDAIGFTGRGAGKPTLAVINDNCNGCNACVGVCPPEFNAIKEVQRGEG